MHFSTVSGGATRQWFCGIPNTIVRSLGRKFGEPGVDSCQPMSEGFRLNVGNHQGVLLGRAMQTMFEPLNAASSMSRQTVNIFKIAAAAVGRCGKPFAFDGKQLFKIVVGSALDPDRAQRLNGDVLTATGSLNRLGEKLDGIKTVATRSAIEMTAEKFIKAWLVVAVWAFGTVTPHREFTFDKCHYLTAKCSGIQHLGIRDSDGWSFGRFVGDHSVVSKSHSPQIGQRFICIAQGN